MKKQKRKIDGVFISAMFLQDFKEETERLNNTVKRLQKYIDIVERKMENVGVRRKL